MNIIVTLVHKSGVVVDGCGRPDSELEGIGWYLTLVSGYKTELIASWSRLKD